MRITEVRVKLMDDPDDRLQAFCSITFDNSFAVRDLKIIEGANGPFVAMPSRKLTAHCTQCGCKNHLRSCFCNQCGGKVGPAAKFSRTPTRIRSAAARVAIVLASIARRTSIWRRSATICEQCIASRHDRISSTNSDV